MGDLQRACARHAVWRSTTRKLTKELLGPFGSKNFLELEMPLLCSDVRLEDINGFTEIVLKATADCILFLMFSRRNNQNVIRHSNGEQFAFFSYLLKSSG